MAQNVPQIPGLIRCRPGHSVGQMEADPKGRWIALSSWMKVAAFCSANTLRNPETYERGATLPRMSIVEMYDKHVDADDYQQRFRVVMFALAGPPGKDSVLLGGLKNTLIHHAGLWVDPDEYRVRLQEVEELTHDFEREREKVEKYGVAYAIPIEGGEYGKGKILEVEASGGKPDEHRGRVSDL